MSSVVMSEIRNTCITVNSDRRPPFSSLFRFDSGNLVRRMKSQCRVVATVTNANSGAKYPAKKVSDTLLQALTRRYDAGVVVRCLRSVLLAELTAASNTGLACSLWDLCPKRCFVEEARE
ncbi:hypothetical protein U1Q18_049215 [Sarracenia purpurea var. burkii]